MTGHQQLFRFVVTFDLYLGKTPRLGGDIDVTAPDAIEAELALRERLAPAIAAGHRLKIHRIRTVERVA